MNSSPAPPGPRVRNSLITRGGAGLGGGDGRGVGVAVGEGPGVTLGEGPGEGVGIGLGVGLPVGVGTGLGLGCVTVTSEGVDSTVRAKAIIWALPGPIALAVPFASTVATDVALVLQLKITSDNSWLFWSNA